VNVIRKKRLWNTERNGPIEISGGFVVACVRMFHFHRPELAHVTLAIYTGDFDVVTLLQKEKLFAVVELL
jgi:hypothetical protein